MSHDHEIPRGVVIAGASVAGLAAADELRASGYEGPITILSDELEPPYDRPPLSKRFLEDLEHPVPELREADHFEQLNVDLRLGHGAAGLDIDRRYLITTDGDALPWEHVIIATGSSPVPMVTDDGYTVPSFRTVQDAEGVRRAVSRHEQVTLIGAGFISLEIASVLRSYGIDVTVIGAGPSPLRAFLGTQVAGTIRRLHEERGVKFIMNQMVEQITGTEGDLHLHLADGTIHSTQYVIAGTGTKSNSRWLDGSGVDLDPVTGAVSCSSTGQTSAPGVWAAGDVASYDNPLGGRPIHAGHWTKARQQATLVARNIMTTNEDVYSELPYFWTDQYDRKLQCYGEPQPGDETVVVRGSLETQDYLVIYGSPDTGRFNAVLSNGMDRHLRPYRKLLKSRGSWAEALELSSTQPASR